MQQANKKDNLSTTNQSIFIPIDLEASLGKIEDSNEKKRKVIHEKPPSSLSSNGNNSVESLESPSKCSRTGITRTSSKTPFVTEDVNPSSKKDNNSVLKPYPVSETDNEIRERKRLHESVDWSNGLVAKCAPTVSNISSTFSHENSDQQSMMEVTVDDFVLSAEEAVSLTDLDARTIQDDDFWETPIQSESETLLSSETNSVEMLSTIPFSVTFSSQDPSLDDIKDDDEFTDAAPIRSVDMEW